MNEFWATFSLTCLVFILYFFPTALAAGREHHQTTAILMLNLLLGWTVLGWIIALVWACTAVRHEK